MTGWVPARWPVLLTGLFVLACDGGTGEPMPPGALAGFWIGSFSILGDSVEVVLEVDTEEGASYSGTVSLPAQSVYDLPVSVETEGHRLTFEVPTVQGGYEGRLRSDGSSIRGDWLQAGGKFRLELDATSDPPAPARPQTPRPPYPYQSEEVRVEHLGGEVNLAGTLTIPDGDGPHPAVVLVSGSGPQDRDEALFGHRPFLVLADHLTRQGIAVLRYDDRGVAESVGDFGAATSEDFATDALAAVDFLSRHPQVDPNGVGIIGHSEGGIVAPMAAVRSEQVAFIVSLAGTGIAGRELLELQAELILEASDVPEPIVALNLRAQRQLLNVLEEAGSPEGMLDVARDELEAQWGGLPYAAIQALGLAARVDRAMQEQLSAVASPWMFFFLEHDPTTDFERVQVPVLALNGSLDLQVPPEPNLRLIAEALDRAGNGDVTTIELDGLNHMFQVAETGSPSEYGRIEETISPEVLDIVASWILDRAPGADGTVPR